MNEQPEALRLADGLKQRSDWYEFDPSAWCPDASAELRRLHALCEEMGKALRDAVAALGGIGSESLPRSVGEALAKWKDSK